MQLIKLKFGLQNAEYLQFLQQWVVIIKRHDAALLKIKNEYDKLNLVIELLQKALQKEKGNALTKLLNQLDSERDGYIIGFIKFLDAMTYHPTASIAANAKSLLHFVNGFGKRIAYTTQFTETTILNSIVDGINNNAERKAALATLNGNDWIIAIDTKNKEFTLQWGNRVVTDTDDNKTESFTSVRKRANAAVEIVEEMFISRYRSEKADSKDVKNFENCADELNELVSKVNAYL